MVEETKSSSSSYRPASPTISSRLPLVATGGKPPKSIGELEARSNKEKYVPPFHMKFKLEVDNNTIDRYDDIMKDQHPDTTRVPLFLLRAKHNETGEEKQYKNMTLIKFAIRCKSCDFKQRLDKRQILKNFKKVRSLRLAASKEHMIKTGHKMEVNQMFERYTGRT